MFVASDGGVFEGCRSARPVLTADIDNVIHAIVKRGTQEVGSLWGDRESAEEQMLRHRTLYGAEAVDNELEIVQLAVERYV